MAMQPSRGTLRSRAATLSFEQPGDASQDAVVMLWSPERKQPLRATVKMPVAATKLAWSPDDRYLAIGSEKGAVYVLKSEG